MAHLIKRFTPEEKIQLIEQHTLNDRPLVELAADTGLTMATLYRWKKQYMKGDLQKRLLAHIAMKQEYIVLFSELQQLRHQEILLQRSLRQKHNELTQYTFDAISVALVLVVEYQLKPAHVCQVLNISRGYLSQRLKQIKEGSSQLHVSSELMYIHYLKAEITKTPHLGYKKLTQEVNRRLLLDGFKPINHKRVYRLLKKYQLR
ncbi:transposase [Motilimonas pumila]|uniref:Transposase n=1 Tax=Motilimonas pumila TaxID=2303987 RepID=A0A418YE36_9GAMM|nr:transposase [Motilimonas pumila]RJG42734.1 hypothetical protein D1Z90_11630 [Motilimonas pumila]